MVGETGFEPATLCSQSYEDDPEINGLGVNLGREIANNINSAIFPGKLFWADFWAKFNPVEDWLKEECDLDDRSAITRTTELHGAFNDWARRNGMSAGALAKWNITRFGRELSRLRVASGKDRLGYKIRRGIKVRTSTSIGRGKSENLADQATTEPPKAADYILPAVERSLQNPGAQDATFSDGQ